MNNYEDLGNELIQILALKTKINSKGQYNVSKLLQVGIEGILTRFAYDTKVNRDTDSLIKGIEHAMEVFQKYQINQEVINALEVGKKAMLDNLLPFHDEIPNPFLCRKCGNCFLVNPPQSCPKCRSWSTTFHEISPIYWVNEFDPVSALANLSYVPLKVKKLIEDIGEEKLITKYNNNWSIREVITHLRDAQGVMEHRIKLFSEQDNPILSSQNVFDWATNKEGQPPTTQDIFKMYIESRNKTIDYLENLKLLEWWKTGKHDEWGNITIFEQVSYFIAHEMTHIGQILNLIHI